MFATDARLARWMKCAQAQEPGLLQMQKALELDPVSRSLRSQLDGQETEASVVFVDMRGFSTRCEGLPPAKVAEVARPFIEEVIRAGSKSHACIDKTIGDEVMLLFPDRADAEKGWRRSLRFLHGLHSSFARSRSPELFTAGVSYGRVVVERVGAEGEYGEDTCYGTTVNAAARACALAKQFMKDRSSVAIALSEYDFQDRANAIRELRAFARQVMVGWHFGGTHSRRLKGVGSVASLLTFPPRRFLRS